MKICLSHDIFMNNGLKHIFIDNRTGIKMISDERLKEIASYDVNFDDDIPEFTDEQLTKFSRQNDKKGEESISQLKVEE